MGSWSILLLKQAIDSLEGLWDDARLDVVSVDNTLRRPRAFSHIPDETSDTTDILEPIEVGKPEIPSRDWVVAKVSDWDLPGGP